MTIKVAINGALGKMGREVIRSVCAEPDLNMTGAIDVYGAGTDSGEAAGIGKNGIPVTAGLKDSLLSGKPDVLVDFTSPFGVMDNIQTALSLGVRPVVGTTGITAADLRQIENWSRQYGTAAFIAPNFAIGAILMMHFAAWAAKYLPDAEIIELHHDKKVDSPSGTAIKTAEMILQARGIHKKQMPDELEKVPSARGGNMDGIRLHSVRLPGFVAHQEVIFGGIGQTLSIRHDSTDRSSFMPGVILAVREVMKYQGVIYGLENILNLQR